MDRFLLIRVRIVRTERFIIFFADKTHEKKLAPSLRMSSL